jgi:hypothetical protein
MSSNSSSSSSLRVLTIESFSVLIYFPAQQNIPSLFDEAHLLPHNDGQRRRIQWKMGNNAEIP